MIKGMIEASHKIRQRFILNIWQAFIHHKILDSFFMMKRVSGKNIFLFKEIGWDQEWSNSRFNIYSRHDLYYSSCVEISIVDTEFEVQKDLANSPRFTGRSRMVVKQAY